MAAPQRGDIVKIASADGSIITATVLQVFGSTVCLRLNQAIIVVPAGLLHEAGPNRWIIEV